MKKFEFSERLQEVLITSVISTLSAFLIQSVNDWARRRRANRNTIV